MKILVSVKRVIDYNVKVRVKSDNTAVDLTNVKMSMNPFCEIAVEEAIRLKEKGIATEVVVVSVGSKNCQETLRTALALGADRAIQVDTEDGLDSLSVAKLLAKVAQDEAADLIIMGKQSIDSDNNQTGQMVAALLDYPQATFASEIVVVSGEAPQEIEVTREIDGGLQTLAITLPAVVTTDLRLNEPRFASLPNIMKAKRKPLDVKTPAELGVDVGSNVRILSVTPPAQRAGGIKVGSVTELVDKLKNEAKVVS
ncbi:electron transfer flavoprotein subunit beta/FixA family protein [Marinomonas sp. IMCC 4694]|uniref:electron transfer flavoprotein subunit beta/FixA family protein n=1 Tax=Marinomonas sp. IMCC 4694 TaxID=2605432 RepID=UPI0011E7C46D|nr:electron transfer flavoprotein subunit beta/FixA family protein [Marinomonas sp. IMCC 4694]TYL48349.1 electron transfer flavoprotein subunit beta/FixA family protein [Marinomonas sp. IMCC 4694]